MVSNPGGIVEVNIGSSFEIVCDATGIPQPIITWRRQGKGDSNQLDNIKRQWIEVTSKNLAGPIECIANNGVGESAIAGVNMIVLCKLQTCLLEVTPNLKLINYTGL